MLVLEGTKRVSLWAPTAGVIEQLGASPGGAFRYTAVARPKGPPPDYVIAPAAIALARFRPPHATARRFIKKWSAFPYPLFQCQTRRHGNPSSTSQ